MGTTKNALLEENIPVSGMQCESCARAIEKSLRGRKGISDVKVNVSEGKVHVAYDPRTLTLRDIESYIEEIGYSVKH